MKNVRLNMERMCKYFRLQALFGCSVNPYSKEVHLWFEVDPAQGAAFLARSFPMKSRQKLTRDFLDTFAPHAGLVHKLVGWLVF